MAIRTGFGAGIPAVGWGPQKIIAARFLTSPAHFSCDHAASKPCQRNFNGRRRALQSLSPDSDGRISQSTFDELVLAAATDPWDEESNVFAPIDLASISNTCHEADEMLQTSEGYRLHERHQLVANALDVVLGSGGVKSQKPHGGTHCWLDLRGFLEWDDFECETNLFWDLYDVFGVLLTPGGVCGCVEPGWFRMHVAAVPEETLATGFDRMERCLKSKQALHGNW